MEGSQSRKLKTLASEPVDIIQEGKGRERKNKNRTPEVQAFQQQANEELGKETGKDCLEE